MAIDLLPVGEELAELDLVVRQLDDGTLTAASDDQVPDGARVRLGPDGGEGIKAWKLVVAVPPGQGSRVAAGLGTINAALSRGGLFVRGSEVRFEAAIDHAPPFQRDELKALYDCVTQGATAQRAAVETLLTPAPAIEPETPLPSSFLPGAGQKYGETATQRFGAVGKVPGRAELTAAERAASARNPSFGSSQGSGGGMIVAGVVGLLVIGGGVAAFMMRSRGGDGAPVAATEASQPGATEAGPSTEAARGARDPDRPATATDRTPRPAPRAEVTEDELLAQARDPVTQADAVERWLAGGHDRQVGARRRMLEALGTKLEEGDPKVGRLVVQSLRDRPPSTAEAIECLQVSAAGVRRLLVTQLSEATGDDAKEAVKALLGEVATDTPDLVIEEALLRLGHARDGAALRLARARGAEWVSFGDGRALFDAVARRDVKHLKSLLEHPDAPVRVAACGLIAIPEQSRDALALLAPVLRDAEPSVRQRAAEGLTALRDPRASWPMARGLLRDEETSQTRDVLRDGLQRLPLKDTVDHLQQLYARPEVSDRRAAVVGLSAIGKPESMPGIVAALRDQDRSVKLLALKALDAACKQPALRPKVTEGLAAIRELGLNRADREVYQIARQLHHQITGRMPEDSVRDQRR